MAAAKSAGNATVEDTTAAFTAEGCSPAHAWGTGSGDAYARHSHDYHKVLFCLSGSIVFHTDEGDIDLRAGDRLDIEPGTAHSATVGPGGCRCVEASR
jgi:mannose-6-phosphate isomerase-like protein (cupin superfamily)